MEIMEILYLVQIKQQNLRGFISFDLDTRFTNKNHTIALFGVFAINADRPARYLDPRVASRIHRALDLLLRLQYRSKKADVLVELHRIITTKIGRAHV